jgi:hypothetical protein
MLKNSEINVQNIDTFKELPCLFYGVRSCNCLWVVSGLCREQRGLQLCDNKPQDMAIHVAVGYFNLHLHAPVAHTVSSPQVSNLLLLLENNSHPATQETCLTANKMVIALAFHNTEFVRTDRQIAIQLNLFTQTDRLQCSWTLSLRQTDWNAAEPVHSDWPIAIPLNLFTQTSRL